MSSDTNMHTTLVQQYEVLVQAMCTISEAYLYEARFDDALRLLNPDILKLGEGELAAKDRIRFCIQRARILRYKGQPNNDHSYYDAALEMLSKADEIAKTLGDKSLQADVTDLIGEVIYCKELWQSTLETPLEHFERGLALRKQAGDKDGIAESLLHIGWVYQHKTDAGDEDTQKAFACFQEAYNLAVERDHKLIQAEAARHLAAMHSREGNLDQALSGHLEFTTISEEAGFKPYLPPGYVMVGIHYLAQGKLDKAMEYCERAYALAKEMGAKWSLAEALFGIGAVKEAQNDESTARRYYQEALAAAQSMNFILVSKLATKKIESLSDGESN
jgi:tetratricopeptide (TPR) repeat protein